MFVILYCGFVGTDCQEDGLERDSEIVRKGASGEEFKEEDKYRNEVKEDVSDDNNPSAIINADIEFGEQIPIIRLEADDEFSKVKNIQSSFGFWRFNK